MAENDALESPNFRPFEGGVVGDDTQGATLPIFPSTPKKGDIPFTEQLQERSLEVSEERETKGFFSTTAHQFKSMEMAAHAAGWVYEQAQLHTARTELENQNPELFDAPEGWKPPRAEIVNESPLYESYLSDSTSPGELQVRLEHVHKLQKEQEDYEDGSVAGKIVGGVGAIAADIYVLRTIPIALSANYATYSQSILMNMARQAPGVALSTVAYTGAMDATTTGKTFKDFAYDSFVNTIAGIGLSGVFAGFGRAITGAKLYETRKALRMNMDGITAKFQVNEQGVVTGMRAETAPGVIQNAMEVSRAQDFLNSEFSRTGLFGLPFVGKGLEKGVTQLSRSPIMRGITSTWGPVRKYFDRMADHSIETAGVRAGVPREENFDYMLNRWRSTAYQMADRVNGYRFEANGTGGKDGWINTAKRSAQYMKDKTWIPGENAEQYFDNLAWGREVMGNRFSGQPSEIAAVNHLNTELDTHYEAVLKEYQNAKGLEEIDFPVKTAASYLSRRYDTNYMAGFEGTQAWESTITNWLAEGDAMIERSLRPLEELESSIGSIKEDIHAGVDVDANRARLLEHEKALEQAHHNLKEEIRDNENLQNLLEENIFHSKEDEDFLRAKLKPHKDAKAEFKKERAKLSDIRSKLRSERQKFEKQTKRGAEPKDYEKIRARITELESAEAEALKLTEAQERVTDAAQVDLMDDVANGTIPRRMYMRNEETGQVTFKNPNAKPKFRRRFTETEGDAHAERLTFARAAYAKIMGQNPEHLAQEMLETLESRVTGNPMKERSLLIPDSVLLDAGLLSTDLERNVARYTMTLGRAIAEARALENFGVTKSGIHGFIEEMDAELQARRRALEQADMPIEKKNKASMKMNKEYGKQVKLVKDAHLVSMGKYGHKPEGEKVANYIAGLRSMVSGTMLGNLPILQVADLATGIFASGLRPWLGGMFRLVKNLNGIIKTPEGVKWRETASEAGLAMERSLHTKTQELWNIQTQYGQTTSSKVAAGADAVARGANILSLSASIENMNQNLIANISANTIIKRFYAYQNGTLSKTDLRKLLQFGIDPAKTSKMVLDAFEASPTSVKRKLGGYASDYWTWDNHEARVVMDTYIRKSVASTLIRKGMFDSPLMSNDPVHGLLFTFTGWYFAALNRFAIPAMQNPLDAYMLQGTMMSLGLSALTDPMRAWSRGEEYEDGELGLLNSAISGAPPLAPLYAAAMRANAIFDIPFLNKLKNDRYRNISTVGGIGGAPAGLVESWQQVGRMFATGNFNQHDIKKFAHSIPMINTWFTAKMINDSVGGATEGLPRTYSDARD